MSRSVVLSLIVAHGIAVAAVIAAVAWTHHKPRPCLGTFERVREGMTRAEVEATVGGPPGMYTPPGADVLRAPRAYAVWASAYCWVCGEAELIVLLEDDRVFVAFIRAVTITPGRWERLGAWLTTGYDAPGYNWTCGGGVPYDLGTLRDILGP